MLKTPAVLTFREVGQIFEAVGINPAELEEDDSEHSSRAGRIYARTGGVSRAVSDTLNRIRPVQKLFPHFIGNQANQPILIL